MRLIIEACVEGVQTDATAAAATIVDVVERKSPSVGDLGFTLAEGRALLAKVLCDSGVATNRKLDE